MTRRALLTGSLLLLAADQLSKFLVSLKLSPEHSIPVLGSFFKLTYLRNPRGVFGLSFGELPLIPLSLVAIALLLIIFLKTPHKGAAPLAISLILGGALGNLVDRLRLGEVIDFLDFGLGRYRWPTFNLADAGVTVGAILLLLTAWKRK